MQAREKSDKKSDNKKNKSDGMSLMPGSESELEEQFKKTWNVNTVTYY